MILPRYSLLQIALLQFPIDIGLACFEIDALGIAWMFA